uniref:Anaphase-promoting complex subunit 4 WD40 domain-containing protein n=1 Tax=Pseudo-nitzschia australis TaxID=44445 RepID=A0A7S4AS35_9STRA
MATQPPPEAKLLDKFPEGISSLQYLPYSYSDGGKRLLASTSWDGAVRVHDTSNEGSTTSSPLLLTHNMESGPLLSSAIPEATTIVTGGLDGSIKSFDTTTSTVRSIGFHDHNSSSSSEDNKMNVDNACSCLSTMSIDGAASNVVVSASWNRQLCVWDLRQQNGNTAAAQALLPGKAFSMDVDASRSRILVATSGGRNCIYDMRMLNQENAFQLNSILERDSSLKFQTRCVRYFPDGHGFCLGSIEGRVGVEFLEEIADERMLAVADKPKKYAFKCHRDTNSGLVYPVNAIEFHPKHRHTFATGGCDGTVVLWDGQNKKKLTALPAFPTSISAMCFSPDGTELAIASSYTHEEGDREQHPQDEVYVRQILDSEATPKTATSGN